MARWAKNNPRLLINLCFQFLIIITWMSNQHIKHTFFLIHGKSVSSWLLIYSKISEDFKNFSFESYVTLCTTVAAFMNLSQKSCDIYTKNTNFFFGTIQYNNLSYTLSQPISFVGLRSRLFLKHFSWCMYRMFWGGGHFGFQLEKYFGDLV